MSAHRYWRVNVRNCATASSYTSIGEIQFRAVPGGANVIGSGTASASSQWSVTYAPQYAVDGNVATAWESASAAAMPQCWAYDFGAGHSFDIVEVVITSTSHSGDYAGTPTLFDLDCSDDGAAWATLWQFASAAWTAASQSQTFTLPVNPPTVAFGAALIRETLYAAQGQLHVAGLVREVLRTTGTGAATYINVDSVVREVLRSTAVAAPPAHGGPMVSFIM